MPHFRNFHTVSRTQDADQFDFKESGTDGGVETREHILLAQSSDDGDASVFPAVQSAREAARFSEAPDDDSGWQGDVNMDGLVDFDDFMML